MSRRVLTGWAPVGQFMLAAIAAGVPIEAPPDLSQPKPKQFTDADREAIELAQQKRARKAARRRAAIKEQQT